jgi:D-aminopeptidase
MRKPRARDLGIPFAGTPGEFNAITDVPGVEVGMTTLISGHGDHAIRTGVTTIWPRDRHAGGAIIERVVPAAWFSLNGCGEMTGTTWIEESGSLSSPIALTNTHSVGVTHDAVIRWGRNHGWDEAFSLPVVAETYDGFLNDINGFHVKTEDVYAALENATAGPVAEGNVGGGTGMMVARFKGGTGSSSRCIESSLEDSSLTPYTVGVLVQANYGARADLLIRGVPVGLEITDLMPEDPSRKDGSIIIVVATDAPLLPHQLKRLAKRAGLGLARTGSNAYNGSGDLFIAFSTATPRLEAGINHWRALPESDLDPVFRATADASEEAIINALVAAETMIGFQGHTVHALPIDRLLEVMGRYNRIVF